MKVYKLLILFLVLIIQSCLSQSEKINGLSYVSHREPINDTHIKPIININANYTAIIPYGMIRDATYPEIVFNSDRQWYGETRSGAKQYIEAFQKQHVKIMLKPQIWIHRGDFTGDMKMESEEGWKLLEDSYSKFILEYATLAQEMNVAIFCIGTELKKFVAHRPEYWTYLIDEITKIYKGKLTYAANWNEFKDTPFWNRLDYIGLDAYFPVSKSKTPTVKECLIGWETHKNDIKSIHETYNKPILFTEFGYRSVDYSGREPWRSDREMNQVNLQAQLNTTKALFETFWNEQWFAGGFVWKWHHNYESSGGKDNTRFTPQNKPVELTIKHYFGLKNI